MPPAESGDGTMSEEQRNIEETIAEIEANPENKRILKQIGVRPSLRRVRKRNNLDAPLACLES